MTKSYTRSPWFGTPSLLRAALAVLLLAGVSGTTLAQRGAVQPAAHAGQQPVNHLPNPYETQRDWGTLPDGRSWGSVSAVHVDIDNVHIWVGRAHRRFGRDDTTLAQQHRMGYTGTFNFLVLGK